ncbi:5-formyltetrahydrofolate cyclo-ligase [Ornithinimicrobium pratense]|uniref:5-formyltetrahydrofolate cyclo-ligase n=1 Tax=Ornithinimicrobium pratense TaxID=2593973 RepID=UPI0017878726|nr:5-formyltetrahydrofolate cyclo-ligase [Ornithinimicrobium pratense]
MSRPLLPRYQPTGDVVADKATWRSLVRAARRELVDGWSEADRAARAEALAQAGLQWVQEHAARAGLGLDRLTVTAFEPMRTEPPAQRLTGALRQAGARVLVPITLARPRLDWADLADPTRGPLGEAVLAQVDVALIPGLAVSEAGVRLGQGGGYYDHTLPRLHNLTAARRVPVVVVLHDHEVVPQVPADEHDAVVDAVLRPGTGVVGLGR